jgi:hypothetical protein
MDSNKQPFKRIHMKVGLEYSAHLTASSSRSDYTDEPD